MSLNIQKTITVAQSAHFSDAIDLREVWLARLFTPAALTATTVIGFYASDDDVTYAPLKDQYNALVQITVTLDAAGAYVLPSEVLGCNFIKIWTCTTAGVDVDQAAARTFKLSLKG